MAKKLLAVILSVLMLASAFSVSVSAADEKSAFEAKVESALGILIGNGEKVDVQVDADLLSALKANGTGSRRLAKSMSNYAVVAAEDVKDVDAVAQAIADGSAYKIVALENGKKTVYISVDLVANPEIFNEDVFRAAVVKLVDAQNEVISEEDAENLDLLDYNRFAGELYLHMIIYRVVAPVKDAQWLPLVADLYNMSSVADMNIDESRIPPFFIEIIGFIIFELFGKLGI